MTINTISGEDGIERRKPVESILSVISAANPSCNKYVAKKSQVIESPEGAQHICYFLMSGNIALHRRGDGIVMMSEKAPFIFGFSNQLGKDNGMYLRALEDSVYLKIPVSVVYKMIEENDLWKPLAEILMYTTTRVYLHCARVPQLSSYDIIRCHLNELMNESDELRQSTAASAYIKSRTYLSRSGIMRILSELRSGGYIKMEKGVLQSINYLPRKY
ncbi:helix-turn-helix domain-containing protein [Enterobacteriaceae bacterium C34A]